MTPLETLDRIHEHANLSLLVYVTNRERVANGLPINLMSTRERPVVIVGADLEFADLQGADLEWTMLDKVTLNRANLRGANLYRVMAEECDFVGVHLFEANMSLGRFKRSSFRLADMRYARLVSTDMRFTDCTGARFRAADLDAADFSDADLGGAMLAVAVGVRTADFENARRRPGDRKIPRWKLEHGRLVKIDRGYWAQ